MKIQATIFELDGTLVDTLEDITRCVNRSLKRMGEPLRSQDEVRTMVGDGVKTLCQRALTKALPERISEMVMHVRHYYSENPIETAAPYEGIIDLLEKLHSMGIRMSVLSNKPHNLTQSIICRMFNKKLFDQVLGQREGFPMKPDPRGALWIAKELNLSTSDLLYIGDSEIDMQTGLAAGVQTIGVTWGFRSADELRSAKASYVANHPREILEVILNS